MSINVELITFDWSGVISDDRMPVYLANIALLADYSLPRMTFEEWLPRTAVDPIKFLEGYGIYGDPKEIFARFKKYLDEAIEKGSVPTMYPDAPDVFEYLRTQGKTLAILSSHPEENLRSETRSYGLDQHLSLILGSSKNKANGLHEVCVRLGWPPQRTLYTGDTIYDIRAAKDAGVKSAGITTGYHTRERLAEEKPDLLLASLSELKQHLQEP